jgi:UDP-2,4-diacetamido-2,4,6-trideoxy-beta-L-altropyranose hydrolase
MRCLTLAEAFLAQGAELSFICVELDGNIAGLAEDKGIKVHRLPKESTASVETDADKTKAILSKDGAKADWLVVDCYALDEKWESQMRSFVNKVMVIDDLADRSHDCDILLDQNYFKNYTGRYEGLVPVYCKKYLGPEYVLLRNEFFKVEKKTRQPDDVVRRLLVAFGGADPGNETAKALRAILNLGMDIAIDVVIGGANPNKDEVERLCSRATNVTLHYKTSEIARIMAEADIAIGSGGSITWERCFLGVPAITLILAENQTRVAEDLEVLEIIVNMGWHDRVSMEDLSGALKKLIDDPGKRQDMSKKGMSLVDGKGVERIISAMSRN